MKWCGRYFCWCDEVEEIIEQIDCEQDCGDCQCCEDVGAKIN